MRFALMASVIIVMLLLFHFIFALVVTGLSALFSNIFPTKLPIGLPIVIVLSITALLGYLVLLVGVSDFQGRFLNWSDSPYIVAWEFTGISIVIYGSIIGLLTYVSSRLWRNDPSRIRIVISVLLVIGCLILLAIGLAYLSLIGFMFAAEW